ncbi:MAG: c-type cytochrome biogenesis protein CcmI [Rhodospirillaceae bacterium]|nr:c-type cytochrome biogenesis protein CcmI [Rhodospirillaceae bacterium]
MIWALLTLVAIAVAAALIWPLVREARNTDDGQRDVAVLKDQEAEVQRDLARGTITPSEAAALKLEIQRRMLAAARRPALTHWREGPGARSALTALLAVSVPMLAFAIYMNLGAPLMPSPAARSQADHDMAQLVDQLAARMQADPNNLEGWALLARSYRQIERYQDALDAYRHVLSLNPPDADPYANFGEMVVTVGGGQVTAEAREAFLTALSRDRTESRARFYLGLAASQNGDARTAIAIWRDLTASAPKDAPWLEMVRNQMFQVAQSAAIMPMSVEPRHPLDGEQTASAAATPTPTVEVQPSDPNDITAPDVSAIKSQFSGENLAQIQAMVGSLAGRLENNPEDFNGWMMLGRSYNVLRNGDGAKQAFQKAMMLKPAEIEPKLNYAAVLLAEADMNAAAPLPEPLTKTAAEILVLAPGQPEALFVRGLAALKAGDKVTAQRDWTTAKGKAQGPLAAELERRLKALK